MAYQPGYKSRVLVGSLAATTYLRKVAWPTTAKMLDSSCFGAQPMTFIPGQVTSVLTADGLLDPDMTSGGLVDKLTTWTTEQSVMVGQKGLVLGDPVQMASSLKTQLSWDSASADLVTVTLGAQTNGITDYGVSLHDLTAVTADADGTAVDNAALTSNGGAGQLHVSAFSGFSGVVIKIQHSTDNITFADLITFTTVAGTTHERIAVAGTVNRYVRASWDVTGSSSITFAAAFARR